MRYLDRNAAGSHLVDRLQVYKNSKETIVLALPRGGVPIGRSIACALKIPMDILLVKKIGYPGQPEFAIGAMSEDGITVLNPDTASRFQISDRYIQGQVAIKRAEMADQARIYRASTRMIDISGKNIILVDDGIATGTTMKAAIQVLRAKQVNRIITAVPVASIHATVDLEKLVDEWICLQTPSDFMAVGQYYEDFIQLTDEDVTNDLKAYATCNDEETTRM